jgi:hypothetical protein
MLNSAATPGFGSSRIDETQVHQPVAHRLRTDFELIRQVMYHFVDMT